MRSRRSLGAGADCHKSTFLARNGGRRLKRTARGGKKRGGTGARSSVGAGRRPRGSEGQCARTRGDIRAKRRVRGSEGNNGQARGASRLARVTSSARRRRGAIGCVARNGVEAALCPVCQVGVIDILERFAQEAACPPLRRGEVLVQIVAAGFGRSSGNLSLKAGDEIKKIANER